MICALVLRDSRRGTDGELLDNLNIVRGERRECYPMQSNRIVGIMSDYRVWS